MVLAADRCIEPTKVAATAVPATVVTIVAASFTVLLEAGVAPKPVPAVVAPFWLVMMLRPSLVLRVIRPLVLSYVAVTPVAPAFALICDTMLSPVIAAALP